MGRGSSGAKTGGQAKPKYYQETDKAVKLKITVEDHILERTLSRQVWVPKSQLSEDGRPGEWITDQKAQEFYTTRRAKSEYTATWEDATGKNFLPGKPQGKKATHKQGGTHLTPGKQAIMRWFLMQKSKELKAFVLA